MEKTRVEKAAQILFAAMLECELTEAEAVAATVMTLTIRIAYAAKDLEDLERKLEKAGEHFKEYSRANLSNAMSALIAKNESIQKEMN